MAENLLQRAEKIFQTDLRYVIKNGGWLMFGQIFIALLGFGLTVAFANLLSQQEYGVYKFIISTGGLIGAFRLNGLRLAVTQAVARGATGTAKQGFLLAARWNCLVVLLSFIVASYYLYQDNTMLAIGIFSVGSYNAAIGALRVYRGYLAGKEQFRTGTIHDLVTTGLAAASIFLALLYTDNILAIVTAGIILPLGATSYFAFTTLHKIKSNEPSSRSALSFGKHMSAQNFLLNIGVHIDKVLLFHWLGSAGLAVYAFALLLPDQVSGLLKNVMGVIVPKFAVKRKVDMRRSIKRKLIQLTSFITFPVIGYFFIAPYLFTWLFPAYLDSIWYSQILMFGTLGLPASYLLTAYFDAKQATKTLYKIKISTSLIKIFLIIVCTWTLGLAGAIIAHLTARLATVFILGYYYLQDSKINLT